MRGLAILAALAVLAGTPVLAANPQTAQTKAATKPAAEPKGDPKLAAAALRAVGDGRWALAERLAEETRDPVLVKLVAWLSITRSGSDASFAAVAAFIAANPGWPQQTLLRRRAEEAIGPEVPATEVLKWFAKALPLTGSGWWRYGEALLATGREADGQAAIRRAWVEGDFGTDQEKAFLKAHRRRLGADDHRARLDGLLWDQQWSAARRMLPLVDAGQRALADARMGLARQEGNVDRLVARVPAELQADAGLAYERIRWRRRKGREDEARDLLLALGDRGRPDRVWIERAILARDALQKGHITDAYRLARSHGLKPADAGDYADAEWFAGWVALRFLNDHAEAWEHFYGVYKAVRYPVSVARAAYWAGRAAESMGKAERAKLWYGIAADHSTTYYGQLARKHVPGARPPLPVASQASAALAKAFAADERIRAARILVDNGLTRWVSPFAQAAAADDARPGWQLLVAEFALEVGRPDVSVAVAKRIHQERWEAHATGYPLMGSVKPVTNRIPGLETALVHAVVRQESQFNQEAESPAGARGLMQLMPGTAQEVAKELNLPYVKARLIDEPAYNLTLGQAYLASLLADFGGSLPLALSAYNAGPGRARAWMRAYGDPRESTVDEIDWIEMIPFSETRNYVQRVLENLAVYRSVLQSTEVAENPAGHNGGQMMP